LLLRAKSGASGEIARQLLDLPTGKLFTLSLVTSGVNMDGQAPVIRVLCARSGMRLAEISIKQSGKITTQGRPPPPGCSELWLSVVVRDTPLPDNVWIDDIAIDSE
jgi:hypothetical protein